ncbi:MAG: hypothetical protein PSX36_11470 [bacterium]|nr:hypothetical protein [bacterium]
MEVLSHRKVSVFELTYGDDGIMYVDKFEQPIDTVESQRIGLKAVAEMTGGKRVPLLVKYADYVFPDARGRDNWAKKETAPLIIAEAHIAHSTALRLIFKFYMTVNKPFRPTRMFTDEAQAVSWLQSFL